MFTNPSPSSTQILDRTVPVVIAGGLNWTGEYPLDIVEVVDSNTNCGVDRIPTQLRSTPGINGMMCGGRDNNDNILSSCWNLYPNGTWTSGNDMLEPRIYFSLNKVEDEIIAIGGETTSKVPLRSIERLLLTNDEGWSRMKDAPIYITSHCTVMVNASYLMIIGGQQNVRVNSEQLLNYSKYLVILVMKLFLFPI